MRRPAPQIALAAALFAALPSMGAARGADTVTLAAPERATQATIAEGASAATATVQGWLCTPAPHRDAAEIAKQVERYRGGNDLSLSEHMDVQQEVLAFMAEKSTGYIQGKQKPPRRFWSAKRPGPWTIDPPAGGSDHREAKHCYTERQLKIMKWDAVRWAEEVRATLRELRGK